MDYAQQQRSWGRHAPSILAVVALHILLGWALVNGLARRVIDVVKQPIETKIIEEIKKPPPEVPPPPPPKLAAPPPPFIPPPEINIEVPQVNPAPTITAVTTVKPPPGPAPVARPAPAPKPLVRKEYKASYRVEPTFPREALRRNLTGRVVAWVHVAPDGSVTHVEIRETTNRIFDREVVRALSQWKFNPEPVGFIGEYEIIFNLKD
ncbi:MAG TPA: energy transducer TonB [Usitatibacter sp.]|nr:energy transducer TonB [Usitatibacter sp.]